MPYIPTNEPIIDPFFGGGGIGFAHAQRGQKLYASDLDQDLVHFYSCVLNDAQAVYDALWRVAPPPITRDRFYQLQEQLKNNVYCGNDKAAAYFSYNRASYSGKGGWSSYAGFPLDQDSKGHFTYRILDSLRSFSVPNMEIKHADWQDALNAQPDIFAYIDPPYYGTENYYVVGNNFDHEKLASHLHDDTRKWALSYGDCTEIRQLYDGYPIVELTWRKAMGGRAGFMKELLVLSKNHELAKSTWQKSII